jgi:hypothetical protein
MVRSVGPNGPIDTDTDPHADAHNAMQDDQDHDADERTWLDRIGITPRQLRIAGIGSVVTVLVVALLNNTDPATVVGNAIGAVPPWVWDSARYAIPLSIPTGVASYYLVKRLVDVDDVDLDVERIELVHRPEQGTTLKNGEGGERLVAISSELAEMLADHIDTIRHNVVDDYDRRPLLTTEYGRMCRTTMRRKIYEITAPCYLNNDCPDCEEGDDRKCPEAVSPHAIRRGSITHYLTEDVPVEVVSDRMDVSRKVLDKHYDKRSAEVKLEQRRGYLDDI